MRRALLCWLLCHGAALAQVVPAPRVTRLIGGACEPLRDVCTSHPDFSPQLFAFAGALQKLGVAPVRFTTAGAELAVEFAFDAAMPGESYRIDVGADRVVATAGSRVGIAWAAATLLQSMELRADGAAWRRGEVRDEPDLSYRSFMVDMGRNPHSPATLNAVVDMLWFYKVGFLHLHLSDDQLFSWPSMAFPKLRSERAGWTRHDFVALEKYAAARGVTIVPELDVPGHSTILRREYPDVFGATPTELASNAEASRGVEVLIREMLDVFESTPFVHVGGDEAYGVPHDVQRAFLNRLNRFVRSKGRRMIVWEGPPIGDGDDKVDTDVLHCCWRCVEAPAQQLLDGGYEVIAAPWDPCYVVDHYPRTMFTAVDLARCYGWDPCVFRDVDPGMPTFAQPHRTRAADGILGFCVPWWEGREQNLFALCLPRLAAIGSRAWNASGERDLDGFLARQRQVLARWQQVSGVELPKMPVADPGTQRDNLAYRAKVTPSRGAHQPQFGPERLSNGITDRFDHFLGYPTRPEPLEIVLELRQPSEVGRVVVHERAVGDSHEVYELLVSVDGVEYVSVGSSGRGTRGEHAFVAHRFERRRVNYLKIVTRGCEGLTFPSFSRLIEVQAFRE